MLIITRMMSEPIVEWVGYSCGKHGAYTFYKGFKLTANGETRKYLLGDFYFIRNSKDRPICIAEFQLLWHDANTDNKLASARLYFRPESIPGGRQGCHGKDELLYTDEKVVINCKDMINLEYEGTAWSYGIKAISELHLQEVPTPRSNDSEETKKFRLMKRNSKKKTVLPKERAKMIILSFSAYCRFKSLLKKLTSGVVLTKMAMKAFGGVIKCNDSTWVSFSRESFHYPGLGKFDMFNHCKAPVLKGRPRKKKVSKFTAVSKEGSKVRRTTIERQPPNEADTSDENTDTSETSSVGGQELPCPPKLVSNIKEEPVVEIPNSVIRSIKQELDTVAIPPMPKLVKIEPQEPCTTPYSQFRNCSEADGSSVYTQSISGYKIQKNDPFLNSVSSSNQYRNDGMSATTHASLPASIHATLVSRVSTVTTSHSMQPRTSTIVSTPLATQGEVTKNVRTSERSGNEQPMKRKRGRPPGKTNKCLRTSEVKIAPKKTVSEMNGDQVHVKTEEVSGEQESAIVENEEYSPEPQDADEREFMKNLKSFMRNRGSPIEKIPALGFRKINLFKMYEVTRALGGYDQVTSKRLWRRVYSEVGGAPSITSAATNSRRHYEKLLLPYERYMGGEDCSLDAKLAESPSPEPDGLALPQKDQNGNVVPQNHAVFLSTSQKEKLSKPAISHAASPQENRLKPAIFRVMNQKNGKSAVPQGVCQQGDMYNPAVTRVMSQQVRRSNPTVTRVMSQQDRQTKPAVSYVVSVGPHNKQVTTAALSISRQDNSLRECTIEQYSKASSFDSRQDRASHPVVEYTKPKITSVRTFHGVKTQKIEQQQYPAKQTNMSYQQDSVVQPVVEQALYTKPKVSYRSKQERILRARVAHTVEQAQCTKSTITDVRSQQDRRSVVSQSNVQYSSDHASDSVETITTRSEGSPVMLYSSNVDTTKYPSNHQFDHRPGVITGTEAKETTTERTKAYITELPDDHPGMYVPQNKSDVRTSEYGRKYVSHFDHNRPRDYHVIEESRDMRKREAGDEIVLTNVVPSKMSRTHSPIPRDEGFMFSVPVFQPSHYPHGGFELYDLPSTTFPVRASSRIFMPPHQVFPGSPHPAFSSYAPHIIATIGTDPGTLYQLPIPGYYPQEIGYPMEAGVQILHS